MTIIAAVLGLAFAFSLSYNYYKSRYNFLIASQKFLQKFEDTIDQGCERLNIHSTDEFSVDKVHTITEIYIFLALLEAEDCMSIMVDDLIATSRFPFIKFNINKLKPKYEKFLPIFNALKALVDLDKGDYREVDEKILGVID